MSKKNAYESRDFLKLRREWYKKLKDEGFDDIEYTNWQDGSSGNLLGGQGVKSWADMSGVRLGDDVIRLSDKDKPKDRVEGTIQRVQAQQRYYELAGQFVWDLEERGIPEEHLEIWRQHADGVSNWEIHRRMGLDRHRIGNIIHKYADLMLKEAVEGGWA